MSQVSDSLRNLAVSLEGRELRLRRGETVSPLGAGFAQGANEASNEDDDDFAVDDEEESEDDEDSIDEDEDDDGDDDDDA